MWWTLSKDQTAGRHGNKWKGRWLCLQNLSYIVENIKE